MNEQKTGPNPAVIGLIIAAFLAVAFVVWNFARPNTAIPTGQEVQKPTGLAPDPSQLPPGGALGQDGKPLVQAPMPPGKGGR